MQIILRGYLGWQTLVKRTNASGQGWEWRGEVLCLSSLWCGWFPLRPIPLPVAPIAHYRDFLYERGIRLTFGTIQMPSLRFCSRFLSSPPLIGWLRVRFLERRLRPVVAPSCTLSDLDPSTAFKTVCSRESRLDPRRSYTIASGRLWSTGLSSFAAPSVCIALQCFWFVILV